MLKFWVGVAVGVMIAAAAVYPPVILGYLVLFVCFALIYIFAF